ncbi:MAG: indolepyruvate oxidoreductase subunit beta [Deltaproteobacteria bacterium]|nr:indolepyruvate oxidoreductase subunit beta [Deltaproteobacteria bacterium]MBW1924663.1 indolepyruvate oxidoreductase subunit beta [Deltaproteobacteria bacterium]MBW1948124.1 indolepyruvate oxidoreductase subunit beta [Deltaproteobacteria bacterium]MBW2008239.1 indolepyruvate oxidoreductase subunit beta [Deltaproteobacteria bacterium]MBW2103841.1 indolepyruvate oxidoreductase subunit beta [Deltaproteobacteria bacterium]
METKRLVFIGVGGQGNLLASRLLGEAALSMGIHTVVSEIHGMAQRGGIVESAVLLGDVSSPIVSGGEADVLVGFEPVETMRALGKCNKDTLVITNTHPLPPFTVAIGQGDYPTVEESLEAISSRVGRLIALDGNRIAREVGNPLALNMVMLGALLGSGAVPVEPDAMKKVISSSTKKAFLESNLKAFDRGMEEATGTRAAG